MKGLILAGCAAFWACWPAPASAQMLLNSGGQYRLNVTTYRDIPYRTVVRQRYDFSCGSAALATLLRYHYGRDVSEEQVFKAMFEVGDQSSIQKVGFSLLDMKRYLATYGYSADGFRLTLEQLTESHSPAIVMVNHDGYRHFVVLKGFDADHVLVGDPALGLKTYTNEKFKAMWNGVAFMIRDADGRFNQDGEWRPWATAPLRDTLPESSLADFTRQLPPLYQITSSFSLNPYLR